MLGCNFCRSDMIRQLCLRWLLEKKIAKNEIGSDQGNH